jgi:hypothetical protein
MLLVSYRILRYCISKSILALACRLGNIPGFGVDAKFNYMYLSPEYSEGTITYAYHGGAMK